MSDVSQNQVKKDLPAIKQEMHEIQEKYRGQSMPEDVAKRWQELGKEAFTIQESVKRDGEIADLDRFMRQVPNQPLPATNGESKGDRFLGYTTAGHILTSSPEWKGFVKNNQPKGQAYRIEVKDILSGRVQVKASDMESKDITIGEGVIFSDRDPEIVRAEEHDRLTLRDVLNVNQTSSNLIEYRRMDSYTRAAAPVAERGTKPQAAIAFSRATAPVRTIAVWDEVTEQEMQDAAQLVGMLQGELRYDLDLTLEEQVVWGDGSGENLLGIMETPGVEAARTGETVIDSIRKAMTDVQVNARRRATAALIDPEDLEEMHLTKGEDKHYLFQTYPTTDGGLRVWGLQLVESIAGTNPATGQRVILVGDFARGATLWDRQQAAVAFGWINDQFITNERTIRAEFRAAFGVKRPQAFRYVETNPAA